MHLDSKTDNLGRSERMQKILDKVATLGTANALTSLDDEEKQLLVGFLRQKARSKYLEDREQRKIELFRRNIEEQDKLFEGIELTKREDIMAELDRELLDLAKQVSTKTPDLFTYKMPLDYDEDSRPVVKKKAELLTRYEQPEADGKKTEEETWLQNQTRGLKRQKNETQVDDQDFVFLPQKFEHISSLPPSSQQKITGQHDDEDGSVEKHLQDYSTTVERPEFPNNISNVSKTLAETIQEERYKLPIFNHREEILRTIRDNSITILVGETGSGKTTQLPQFLAEAGYTKTGKIAITQPRRVAAMSVASRVAYERQSPLGSEVGYSVRFESCLSEDTKAVFMTDGMLLNEFVINPDLSAYSVVVLDEAHERTLHTDILFGLLKDLIRSRSDFKLVIASATLDSGKFAEYFDNAPVVQVPGRRYPVDIYYTKTPETDYIEAAVITALQIHITQPNGDILVFLTGQEEIESAKEQILSRVRGTRMKIGDLMVLPLYSMLPADQQIKIFEPTPAKTRKIILSTNIAETSLTIPNIVYVIDCGFAKQTAYNPRTGLESLVVAPISKASADQRAGRAGRVCPGKCFRLYTTWSFEHELEEIATPEIQRSNLSSIILTLKCIGIDNFVNFDFMDAPNYEAVATALSSLFILGALDESVGLTDKGRKMSEFPLPPNFAKAIVESDTHKCVRQVLTICAMLTCGQGIFLRPRDKILHADKAKLEFERPGGDHLSLLNAFKQWEESGYSESFATDHFLNIKALRKARDIRDQLMKLCQRVGIDVLDSSLSIEQNESVTIRKAFLAGFFMNCARLSSNKTYRTVKKNFSVMIHPSSFLHSRESEWVIYDELVLTTKEFMRNVFEIEPQWLIETAPFYFNQDEILADGKLKNLKKLIGR